MTDFSGLIERSEKLILENVLSNIAETLGTEPGKYGTFVMFDPETPNLYHLLPVNNDLFSDPVVEGLYKVTPKRLWWVSPKGNAYVTATLNEEKGTYDYCRNEEFTAICWQIDEDVELAQHVEHIRQVREEHSK